MEENPESPDSPDPLESEPSLSDSPPGVGWLTGAGILFLVFAMLGLGLPFVLQDTLMYFPRRYEGAPPPKGDALSGFEAYTTADGLQQWGYRIDPPPGSPPVPEGLPAFYLVFYGNGSLSIEMEPIFRVMAEATGCGFFIVDYRGYGFNPGKPNETGLTNDALGAYDSLKASGALERGVGAIGHSMGAAVAIALTGARPIDRLLLLSPFTSVRDMARESMPLPFALVVRNDWPNEKRLAEILEQPAGKRPQTIAIMHGAHDEIIPVSMARRLAALAGTGLELKVYEKATHNDIFNDADRDMAGFLLGESIGPIESRTPEPAIDSRHRKTQ